jgi:cell division protein FtsA
LAGARELAQQVLGKQVRIGRPRGIAGLPDSATGPAFSTCAGLLVYATRAPLEVGEAEMPAHFPLPDAGGFQRMGRWLRENL